MSLTPPSDIVGALPATLQDVKLAVEAQRPRDAQQPQEGPVDRL